MDFDIRYGAKLQSAGTVTEPFPAETIVVLCSPKLTTGSRAIRKPADLRHHKLIPLLVARKDALDGLSQSLSLAARRREE